MITKLAVSYAYDKMDLIESILLEAQLRRPNPHKVSLAIEYAKQIKAEMAKNESNN